MAERKVWLLLGLACLVCLPDLAASNATGANLQACSTMSPSLGHGGSSQTRASPYVIQVSSNTYTPGGSALTVTLKSECTGTDATFKGFLLAARHADTRQDQSAAVGSLDTPSGTQNRCPSLGNALRTHIDNSLKSTVTFTWTPPSTDEGPVVFRATFVQSFTVYWVDVHSDIIEVQGGTPVDSSNLASSGLTTVAPGCTGAGPAPTTQPPTTFTKDPGCGSSKGCYSDCSGNSCGFLMTWAPDNTGTNIAITLKGSVGSGDRYVAFGLSSDKEMGGDSVTECTHVGGNINVYNSKNNGKSNSRLAAAGQAGLTLVSSDFTDGVLTCSFTRTVNGPTSDVFNLDGTTYNIFLAIGPAAPSNIGQHDSIPDVSASAVSLQDITVDVTSAALSFPLVKAHGSLMMVAWIFAASIGIVVARYFKNVWPDSTWFGQKIWFQIHRGCMVVVLLSTVAAFIIIFVDVGEYSEITGETYKKAHPVLGIIVTALCVLNPIMALFRPHPNTKNRPIFNWAHWAVGTTAHILGVVTIFFGVRLEKAGAPDYLIYVLVAFVGWEVLILLLLELTQCVGRNAERSEMYEMSANGGAVKPATTENQSSFTKRLLLGTHLLVMTGFIIALLVILNLGKDDDEDHDH